MPRTIAFLHTAQSNADLFEQAVEDYPLERSHLVRDDLLARAVVAGGLTPEIREETKNLLRGQVKRADTVLVTCSTLGPAADDLGDPCIRRVDRALAEAAVAAGKPVKALCTVRSTLDPTGDLFSEVAASAGVPVDVELIDGAWALFECGDMQGYFSTIALAADLAAEGDVTVALAQASMAPAAALCRTASPLTSLTAAMTGL